MRTWDPGELPTNFCLKRTRICVFCDFGIAADLLNLQRNRWLRVFCSQGSSPAAPAISFVFSVRLPPLSMRRKCGLFPARHHPRATVSRLTESG